MPKDCFINLIDYKTMKELELYIDNMSKKEAINIIQNGKLFLESDNGKKFSYEYFAQDMLKMIRSIDSEY